MKQGPRMCLINSFDCKNSVILEHISPMKQKTHQCSAFMQCIQFLWEQLSWGSSLLLSGSVMDATGKATQDACISSQEEH